MSFVERLTAALKAKNLSDGTVSLYLRNLKKLNGDVPLTSFKYLQNIDDVLQKIAPLALNTQRSYLISVVSSLNTDMGSPKGLSKKYYDHMISKNKEVREVPSSKLSTVQRDNWCKWEDVVTKRDELKEQLQKWLKPRKASGPVDWDLMLKYLVLCLYTMVPPRRNKDYIDMLLKPSDTENYIDMKKREFVFNDYKTSKTYGSQIIQIPDELFNVLSKLLRYHPGGAHLLVDPQGAPLNGVNGMTRLLNRIFQKRISSSMLRHIYLTDKYGDVTKEREKDAEAMGHSMGTQTAYVKEAEA